MDCRTAPGVGVSTLQANFDAAWRTDAIAGRAEAIAALAAQAVTPLYRFCYYRVGKDCHVCEDVVQEAMLAAIAQLDRYDPDRCGGDIFPWLTGLARNAIRRALSRRTAPAALDAVWLRMDRELLSLYGVIETEPLADELIGRDETRDMVNATMSQLPGHYGQALEAKYVHNRTVGEIAAASGQTTKAVESMLTRARTAFRKTWHRLSACGSTQHSLKGCATQPLSIETAS